MPKGKEYQYATKKQLKKLQKEVDDNFEETKGIEEELFSVVIDLDKRLKRSESKKFRR